MIKVQQLQQHKERGLRVDSMLQHAMTATRIGDRVATYCAQRTRAHTHTLPGCKCSPETTQLLGVSSIRLAQYAVESMVAVEQRRDRVLLEWGWKPCLHTRSE
jgi:hypothetical protein